MKSGEERRSAWRAGLRGALLGFAVGVLAHLMDASPWWWLAIPIGFALASGALRFHFSISWGRK